MVYKMLKLSQRVKLIQGKQLKYRIKYDND